MSSASWWLVERLSRLLERDEREAARGDLQESGESGFVALLGMLGLVARRYGALWMHWQPWAAPLALIAPYVLILGGRRLGQPDWGQPWLGMVSLQVSTLSQYKTRSNLGLPVFDDGLHVVLVGLLIILWSWVGGYAFGALARRLAWIHPALAAISLCLVGAPIVLVLTATPPMKPDLLLWLVPVVTLVLAPLIAGVYSGSQSTAISLRRIAFIGGALAVLTALSQLDANRIPYDVWARGESVDPRLVWNPQLFPFAAIAWQLCLMTSVARWQRRLGTPIS